MERIKSHLYHIPYPNSPPGEEAMRRSRSH
jgi:hypothetical protein